MKQIFLFILLVLFYFPSTAQTYTINQGGDIATCSGSFYDSGGASGNYGNHENYTMTFCSNNSTCIKVTFTSFSLDSADYLYIYDGNNTASTPIAVLTGSTLPSSYSSFFGCLTFQFVSNDTITSSGWAATFSCGTCAFSGGGNGTLTPVYDKEACGLNFVEASKKVTTRYTSPPSTGLPATLTISGLPAPNTCWAVEKALMYWTESSNSNGAVTASVKNPAGATFSYNVSPVGVGPDKCWNSTYTTNYRIDVTASVAGNGNYVINISSGSYNVDGITLIIIYRDLNASYTGRLMINDGLMVSNSGSSSYITMNNVNACANSTSAQAFLMVGDMQDNISPGTHTTELNGSAISFPNLFWNYDETSTSVTAGQASAQFGTTPAPSDCYSVVAVGLYYQTACKNCPSNAFSVPISQTVQTCSGGNIVANPGGGSSPYTYVWNTGGTTQSLSGLGSGTYSVTVTDNIGCRAKDSIAVNAAPPIQTTAVVNNITCNGANDGSINVTASGGTPAFSYAWNTGSTANSISNLAPGTYSLVTTDSVNCTKADSFTITSPAQLVSSLNAHNVTCNGGSNGSIQSLVSGGTSPYSYSWNNGGTQDSIFNLTAGTYTLTATDTNGCTVTSSVVVNQPQPMATTLTGTNLLCNNDSSGTAQITGINGGTAPYSILWSTGDTTQSIDSLSAGINYTVVITDSNNCSVSDSISLTQPAVLLDSTGVTDVLCNGDATGTVNLHPYGGTSPYQYVWNNGANTQNLNNVASGTYYVTITDANGCMKTDTALVNQPPAITLNYSVTPTCKDSCYGGITFTYSGGTPPFQLVWSTGDTNLTSLDSLCKGYYTYTLTDAHNCVMSDSIDVGLLSNINANFTFTPDSALIPDQVSFTDSSVGSIVGWEWTFGDSSTSNIQDPTNMYTLPGTYPVTLIITDSLGCRDSYTTDVTVLPKSSIVIPNVFTPNGDGVNDVFQIKDQYLLSLKVDIYNRWGGLLYKWDTPDGSWDGRTMAGKEAPSGTYFYIIKFETIDDGKKGKIETQTGTITLIR